MTKRQPSEREIRTSDLELKAIHKIRAALAGLDAEAQARVMTFCLDRARDEYQKAQTKSWAPPPPMQGMVREFSHGTVPSEQTSERSSKTADGAGNLISAAGVSTPETVPA